MLFIITTNFKTQLQLMKEQRGKSLVLLANLSANFNKPLFYFFF